MMVGRKRKISDEEFLELWKRTKGNVSEIARIMEVNFRTALRVKQRLESQGKLVSRTEIKPTEVAELITDFDSIPEIAQFKIWLQHPTRQLSPKYIGDLSKNIERIWRFLNKRPVTWTSDDIQRYLVHMQERKVAKSYLFKITSSARQLFTFLGEKQYIDFNDAMRYIKSLPTRGLKGKPEQVIALTKAEFNQFHEAFMVSCDDDYDKKLWSALMWVKATTGIRSGDPYYRETGTGICGLRLNQMRIINDRVIFDKVREKGQKGGKIFNDIIPSPIASKKLLDYLQYRKSLGVESDFVFCKRSGKPLYGHDLTDAFQKTRLIAKIDRVKVIPHTLRHCFLTWLVDAGVPLEQAIDINVGWDDINTARDFYLEKLSRKKEEALKLLWQKEGL